MSVHVLLLDDLDPVSVVVAASRRPPPTQYAGHGRGSDPTPL